MANFASRLQTALEMNNMTAAELSRRTGISEGSLSQYLRGTFTPKADKVFLISQTLNVSPNWLLSYDEPDEKLLSLEIATLFRSLPHEYQLQAVQYIRFLKSEAEKTNSSNHST